MSVTYEELRVTLVLGRGIVIDHAPEHAKVPVSMLSAGNLGIDLRHPGHIDLAYQVEYEITGYDDADHCLTLHLVHDWRPGQKDDPASQRPDANDHPGHV